MDGILDGGSFEVEENRRRIHAAPVDTIEVKARHQPGDLEIRAKIEGKVEYGAIYVLRESDIRVVKGTLLDVERPGTDFVGEVRTFDGVFTQG